MKKKIMTILPYVSVSGLVIYLAGLVFASISIIREWSVVLVDVGFNVLILCSSVALIIGLVTTVLLLCCFRSKKLLLISIVTIFLSTPPVIFRIAAGYSIRNRNEFYRTQTTRYNMGLLYSALRIYSDNNGGYLPDANNWMESLMSADPSLSIGNFRHPVFEQVYIAFNSNISNCKFEEIPWDIVIFFETNKGIGLSGDEEMARSTEMYEIYLMLNTRHFTYFRPTGDGVIAYENVFRWKKPEAVQQ